MEKKVFSNLMQLYDQKMDAWFKEYNRTIAVRSERFAIDPAAFVALTHFIYMKQLQEKK